VSRSPAAEAVELLLEGVDAGEACRAAARVVVLRVVFLQLAEARGLLDAELGAHGGSGSWVRLMAVFEAVHARRGGRLFAPERSEALARAAIADARLHAVLERCREISDGAEVEVLGAVHEAMRGGVERRRTSTHYTPRALAERIVARTLEPLLSTGDPARLRVCDPAMGSGVFLLAACRLLGSLRGEGESGPLLVALEQLCGVDEDPEAVELAKLSLWLETRAAALPFTCFDHALRCGDALVGLRPMQLRRLDWRTDRGAELEAAAARVDRALSPAVRRPAELAALAGDAGPAAARRRAELFAAIERDLAPTRALADRVLAAFLSSLKTRERNAALAELARASEAGALPSPAPPSPAPPALHWWLDFPQLGTEPGGVDAVVGNPPFLGKNGLLAKRGRAYLDWLKQLHPGSHGNADYAAHFFRRAGELIGERGCIGLVATNTIGQGDTRTTGLARLLAEGAEIYSATEHLEWPGAANVTVSIVHLARGPFAAKLVRHLDGREVTAIDSRLQPHPERPDPLRLSQQPRRAFIGTYLLGRGFVLDPAQREALVAKDPRNAERIRPYIGGGQLNSSPTQTADRFAIDFADLSLEQAAAWPDLLDIVRREVKPGRERLGDNPDGRRRKRHWWQHGRATPALHAALAPLSRCLVTSLVNKHLSFAFQPARRLFSHKLCVFALDSWAAFAVLQSRVHGVWAWLLSSTMRNAGINYSPSDCFETFPWPQLDGELESGLEQAGERLERARARYMIEAGVGLTKTYNALAQGRAPAVEALRELHVEVDRAVLRAYGWADLEVPAYRGTAPGPHPGFEEQVFDRLYDLNARQGQREPGGA
jgi:hypothetical protein